MVAKNEIWTPSAEVQELAEEFRKETKAKLKEAAIKLKCAPEELKYRIVDDDNGIIEIQRST